MFDAVPPVLGVALAATVFANWWSRWHRLARLEYATKPVATALVIGLAVTIDAASRWEQTWVVVALVLCLAGDVLLMLPRERFVGGLAAFLLGHLAFIAGYGLSPEAGSVEGAAGGVVVVVLLGTPAFAVLRAVRADHGGLFGPVAAYVVVIMTMVVALGWGGGPAALAGAAVFAISDTILAWDRFVRTEASRGLQVAVMATYHTALVLLTLALR